MSSSFLAGARTFQNGRRGGVWSVWFARAAARGSGAVAGRCQMRPPGRAPGPNSAWQHGSPLAAIQGRKCYTSVGEGCRCSRTRSCLGTAHPPRPAPPTTVGHMARRCKAHYSPVQCLLAVIRSSLAKFIYVVPDLLRTFRMVRGSVSLQDMPITKYPVTEAMLPCQTGLR